MPPRTLGRIALCLAFSSGAYVCAPAGASVLMYDGSLGTAPGAQGYLTYGSYLTNPLVSAGDNYTIGAASVTLDSTSDSTIHSGFSDFNGLVTSVSNLDRSTGFSVNLTMRTISESHTGDRAGFNLVALSSDHMGVEIAFWPDEIWAQNSDFTKAAGTEDATFDTTASLKTYTLNINGSDYTLLQNGVGLLSGSLRDYSSYNPVYGIDNLIFLGDDTTSAAGATEVSQLSAVPEPAPIVLLGAVSLFALACDKRRRAAR